MKWLNEYPELSKHITLLSETTDLSLYQWSEFMDELRLELEKPRCECSGDAYQPSFDYFPTFGDTK